MKMPYNLLYYLIIIYLINMNKFHHLYLIIYFIRFSQNFILSINRLKSFIILNLYQHYFFIQ